ncbi:uncharacterized protein K02A2.6-like [Rhipicephalus sanguineus]|uniref:uncharacterized protein K02A2.6-like n=1 Tax=Rhipicephalus sanguineus TaxID=34632 RepID=UPI0020C39A33|nr:uncharacterized protein K02A2.6-like [Rhipicephalus sanguineus]
MVVPASMQVDVLRLLHEGHPGAAKMKAVVRSHVWWPAMDDDVTASVQACRTCQENQRLPRRVPVKSWPFPERPWSRIHVDYAGPLRNAYLLIAVDAYSKWIEVFPVPSLSTPATIGCLRKMFATHGLPDVVVSGNGPTFVSEEYKIFLRRNGIRQIFVPPYHPASNGAAERAVQTIKQKLKKAQSGGDLHVQIARILLTYRTTPQEVTGCSPAELLMGRKLKTALDLLPPDLRTPVMSQQISQSLLVNRGSAGAVATPPGTTVFARNFRPAPVWVPATVEADKGYAAVLRLPDGPQWTRHHDHVRAVPRQHELSEYSGRSHTEPPNASGVKPAGPLDAAGATAPYEPADTAGTTATTGASSGEFEGTCVSSDPGGCASAPGDAPKPVTLSQTPIRRSSRVRKPVMRYVPQ